LDLDDEIVTIEYKTSTNEFVGVVEGGAFVYDKNGFCYDSSNLNKEYIEPKPIEGWVNVYENGFGGFYDSSKKHYRFQITSYIQDILSGKLKQYETYIAPVSTDYNRSVGPAVSGNSAGGSILGSGKSGVSYQMKLRIIYSKIN
jgi:hypothetical protein